MCGLSREVVEGLAFGILNIDVRLLDVFITMRTWNIGMA